MLPAAVCRPWVQRAGGSFRFAARPQWPVAALAGCRWASTVFNVKPRSGEGEQTLFVVGLNEGKFFGQDGAEEGLKLLERIVQHGPQSDKGPQYNLLLGISERELLVLEEDHKVKNERLTPSRALEGEKLGEMVPLFQASSVDKRPRRAVGRSLKISQGHVSWQLWRHPREAVKLYWAFWQRGKHKDAACRKFWMKHFPICAYAYFSELSLLMATRSVDFMVTAHNAGKPNTWVLVVSNQFFEPTVERLSEILDSKAPEKFESADFQRHMREQAAELCVDAPDFTPMLMFVYAALPILIAQSIALGIQSAINQSGVIEEILPPERRD